MIQQPAPFAPSVAHRLWRTIPPNVRRRGLARATAWLAPHPDRQPPACQHGIAIGGELSRASGLGEGARLMAQAARRLGLPVWTVDIAPPVDATTEVAVPACAPPPPEAPLVLHVNGPLLPLALLRLPRALLRGRRVIGYWAWELPEVPPEWRAGLDFVHEIWVPSHFTAAALEPLMPGRVRVVPPPLAAEPPVPACLDRSAFGLPDDAVVVLVSFNLASSFARKNPLAAIAAFRAAFGDRPDRILVMKVSHADHAPEDFARLVEAARAPNIRLETRLMPPADRHALTAAADIVLSLHRSEGFGLVPAEAMLLGRPVIATGWSGNLAYMNRDNAALVGYRLVPTEDSRRVYHDSYWADPNQSEAVMHLRRLADDATVRQALGAQGREATRRCLGASPLSAAIRGIGLALPH
jgi:glycosyltransferase involved in cell wall biosynthesis